MTVYCGVWWCGKVILIPRDCFAIQKFTTVRTHPVDGAYVFSVRLLGWSLSWVYGPQNENKSMEQRRIWKQGLMTNQRGVGIRHTGFEAGAGDGPATQRPSWDEAEGTGASGEGRPLQGGWRRFMD